MRFLISVALLLFFAGCSKSSSMRGLNEIGEVSTSLFRNNKDDLGYIIIAEGGSSSGTSGNAKYRVHERKIDYAAVQTSVFSRIKEEIKRKGFRINGWSSYGNSARCWEFEGLGISGVLRAEFSDGAFGEFATIIYVAVRKNETGA